MSAGGWARALGAYTIALAVANAGLAGWLRLGGPPATGGDEVASAWRGGVRVARKVGTAASGALAAEAATPGTTVVLERILAEGRVLTLGRRLFGLSFVAGRDGVRASLDGGAAVLTPDDLVASGLYRPLGIDADGVLDRLARELGVASDQLWRRGGFRRFTVARVVLSSTPAPVSDAGPPADADRPGAAGDTKPTRVDGANWVGKKPDEKGAIGAGANAPGARAGVGPGASRPGAPGAGARGPGASASAAATPAAATPAAGPPAAVDTVPTAPRLGEAIRATAAYLVRRLGEDGRFADGSAPSVAAGAGAGAGQGAGAGAGQGANANAGANASYDWTRHALVTAFLAAADNELDDLEVRIAAQRAGFALRTRALGTCGGAACVGEGDHVETRASAAAVLAFGALGARRVGASFREPARELAAFLRAQQRPDGSFASGYDRTRRAPEGSGDAEGDALGALALARAHRLTRAPDDLAAAARALERLARRPGWLGARTPAALDPRFCEAADEIAAQQSAAGAGATPAAAGVGAAVRELCLEGASGGGFLELGAAPVADYAGGVRSGFGWTPDLGATAAWAEEATAALAIGLRDGRSARSLAPLGARVTRSLALLLRTQLPGVRPYLARGAAAVAGAFPGTPVEMVPRNDVSAAAGSAMLRYLALLEARAGAGSAGPRRVGAAK